MRRRPPPRHRGSERIEAVVPSPVPLLLVLSGPSGAGKDAVLARLRERGVPAHYAVTATTRPPRAGERDGIDYHFVSEARFAEMIERAELMEHARVYDRSYGVPKEPLALALARGEDVLIRVDVQGAATIKKHVPQAITVLIAPAVEEVEARLLGRGTEDDAEMRRRRQTSHTELARLPEFDYAIGNADGRLDDAVDTVVAILRAERWRVGRQPPTIA